MVAKISVGKSIQRMLNYNENKVKAKAATCLHENLFSREAAQLSFYEKLQGIQRFAERNQRATSKAVHISLNFHPDEKLPLHTLTAIADTYMQKIGFADQPYLVYQHTDAAHPHLHIITTNIRANGDRIILYNIGRNQSEKARQEIEKDFKLIPATGQRKKSQEGTEASVSRAVYGAAETHRAIANAVTIALRYKFTSLPEFNAILKQFNVIADRGREGSFMHTKKGLLFFLLDSHGNKVGVPIKASSLPNKPTLNTLEKLFRKNEVLRMPHRDNIKAAIDRAWKGNDKVEARKFIQALNRDRIFVLFRQNAEGLTYGITFVDNKNKVVFNGSDLGKPYSAKAITDRLTETVNPKRVHIEQRALDSDFSNTTEVLTSLLTAQQYDPHLNPYTRRKKKKRKRP